MTMLSRIFGDANERALGTIRPIIEEINGLEAELGILSVEALKEKSLELRAQVQAGTLLDDILPQAFALVRETSRRVLGQRHFDAQLMGGVVLHRGNIAEMKTGEGKTLAATAPAYLNALTEKGVHIVTVNDYLARRDAVWMGQIYYALGLKTACLAHEQSFLYDPSHISKGEVDGGASGQSKDSGTKDGLDVERDSVGGFRVFQEFLRPVSRKEAYAADIVYGTNHEFGFDYLRDNLAYNSRDLSQRPPYYAIVDEVDSILIDEARTPLIISAPDEDATKLYREFSRIIPRFKENEHYNVDEKMRAVTLSDEGMEFVGRLLGRGIFEEGNLVLIHHLEEALKAYVLFKRDRDYVAKNGEIILVDEFTGRLMPGRRYTGGLHQALEAKEGLPIKQESRILATITLQNYFRMYEKLAGMTGTAATSAEELHKVYGVDVVIMPTNRPMVRNDVADLIFQTERGKFAALVREIKERHVKGQPLLVGTISIEKNEYLSQLLKREGIPFEMLNAKNHEREALIIAQAGRLRAVTVATNMAGRGVDIILGGNPPDQAAAEKVKELGGLHVIGTERHEARRIDNQLRGRAGRQGDPGSSQFFVSLEDDLMRVFGSERIKNMMERFGIPEDEPIQNVMVSRALDAAQGKIEGFNFDLRKHVLEYDDVLNKQRDAIYKKRSAILQANHEELGEMTVAIIRQAVERMVKFHISLREEPSPGELYEILKALIGSSEDVRKEIDERVSDEAGLIVYLENLLLAQYAQRVQEFGKGVTRQGEGTPGVDEQIRAVLLRVIDILWMMHLETMENLRDSVRLRAYGQHDPLVEYKSEGYRLYREFQEQFISQAFTWLLRL